MKTLWIKEISGHMYISMPDHRNEVQGIDLFMRKQSGISSNKGGIKLYLNHPQS